MFIPKSATAFTEFTAMGGTTYHRSGKMLGRGATSEVFLGMQDDGSLVALKCVNIPEDNAGSPRGRRKIKDEMEAVLQEVDVMQTLRHDDIVAYLGTAVVGNQLLIISEYVSGGSLHGALESFGKTGRRCNPTTSSR